MRRLAVVLLLVVGCDSGMPAPNQPDPLTPADSVQLASPEFTLQPGEELFKCWYTSIPKDQEIAAVRFRSKMTPGSHHFIVYTTAQALRPDGTFEDCGAAGGTGINDAPVWMYAAQDPDHKMEMPVGVAMPLRARQPLYFDMHYINATTSAMKVRVTLDLDTASGNYQRAGAFVTFNTQIKIPPGGTQTVKGDCTVPDKVSFFTMSTHSHKRTTEALAARSVNGAMGDMLVHTTDWEHAAIQDWKTPFLVFAPNEDLHYECTYKNDTNNTITVGESAEKNEMCMAVGYYFPATGTSFCLNSLTLSR